MHILDMNLSVTKVSVRVRWCACALKSPVPHWHAILGYDIRAMDFGSKVHCSLWIKATEEKKKHILK